MDDDSGNDARASDGRVLLPLSNRGQSAPLVPIGRSNTGQKAPLPPPPPAKSGPNDGGQKDSGESSK
jgi:hypothetical protein